MGWWPRHFGVSKSGGTEINNIALASNGSNLTVVKNRHNITVNDGIIDGGGEPRISARPEFPNTSDTTISNIRVNNSSVREPSCGDNVNWVSLPLSGGSYNTCDS